MKPQLLIFLITAALLTGCASRDYTPWLETPDPYAAPEVLQRFTLERTACFGFCPIYKVTVDENDFLQFTGERFVAEEGGTVSKRLPDGSFRKLQNIAKAHNFAAYDPQYPNENGTNCGALATDLPTIVVGFSSKAIDHQVRLDQGCMNFPERENFDAMVLEMDAVLNIDDWIGPREAFYGQRK